MKNKKIFIRVDSGRDIGIGHIMRCMSLAETLARNNFEVIFISKKLDEKIYELIIKKGYKINILPENENNANIVNHDAIETQKIIVSNKDDSSWLIVDHRNIDIQWEQILRKHVQKIIVIDDLADKQHDCDMLIDQNLYEEINERYENLVPKNCKMLLGPRYALLRSEFSNLRQKLIKNRTELRNILISFGGTDPSNETRKVLEAIKILNLENIHIDVVTTSINPFKDEIQQLCSSMTNINFYCDVDKIGDLMSTSDLAIGAGGSTTWERCCLGLPSLVSVISEDQLECTRVMGKEGHIIYLGLAKKLTIHDYVIGIKNLDIQNLQKISKLNLKLVDGQGCQRILDEMRLLN
ncbi:UDP-2,4-diacetamido-2,4,6-trideoxy-beta-L-altropyranose hydrolase [Candidatus Nitrosopelagicus sp.]|nr:UDP-2,4-diacetamido-2,4,6-trideoxy-beta-L-altropyranose hydrolase [Candidatus Nitrosopelagicus sp.]MDC0240880.1 UDP-2,4-diacetamido-2,4,6-trideoxy-beta-L-altropyranose hydrolase [Candidatus Nitrosopelagicus sp.]